MILARRAAHIAGRAASGAGSATALRPTIELLRIALATVKFKAALEKSGWAE
jgi:hypothetical protein